jgi:hypothetical protein
MKPTKFRHGDIVYSPFNEKVRVLRSYGEQDNIMYEVVLIDKDIKTCYSEKSLSFHPSDYNKNNDSDNFVPASPKCPVCNNPWNYSTYGRWKWYDCFTCKDTAENICKRKSHSNGYWI